MQQYPFIFSNEKKYQILRHVAFWIFWWLFQAFLYSFLPVNNVTSFFTRLPLALVESFIFMVNHVFLAYSLIYIVIPRFLLRQRYWLTVISTIFFFFLTAGISTIIALLVIPPLREFLLRTTVGIPELAPPASVSMAMLAGLRGGITVGGIAAAIKLMKYWYVKEQRNLELQKENIEVQMHMLKAQVHPHFLFNSLNNIYSHTQTTSPLASKLITGLSDMLRFILYECNQPTVPLAKELKMIEDYISLEKIRYDDKLELHVDIPAYTNDLQIAPLVLLPLVENCFTHGTSKMLEQPWLSLHISVENNTMVMKLMNGTVPANAEKQRNHGIGIKNVRKRLELLYPGKHEITITADDHVFIVALKVQLDKIPESTTKIKASPSSSQYV